MPGACAGSTARKSLADFKVLVTRNNCNWVTDGAWTYHGDHVTTHASTHSSSHTSNYKGAWRGGTPTLLSFGDVGRVLGWGHGRNLRSWAGSSLPRTLNSLEDGTTRPVGTDGSPDGRGPGPVPATPPRSAFPEWRSRPWCGPVRPPGPRGPGRQARTHARIYTRTKNSAMHPCLCTHALTHTAWVPWTLKLLPSHNRVPGSGKCATEDPHGARPPGSVCRLSVHDDPHLSGPATPSSRDGAGLQAHSEAREWEPFR